jgi:SAM-dependent methyltransferase
MTILERMRRDWDRRAREDANFYAGFVRRKQSPADFFASAPDTVRTLEAELVRLPLSASPRHALEIGCGPGRLMGAMAGHFDEVHGVDISAEMVTIARENLKSVTGAYVHVTPDSTLRMFPDAHFDFIYSYIVFQHIPSREVVLGYLEESRRVLKPGGILCCQLRGTPPMATELERETETWTGCHFTADELMDFSNEHSFPLVAIWGIETQYMWTVWRNPTPGASRDYSRVTVKDVTISNGSSRVVPQRGHDALISLWIENLPENAGLSRLEITIAGQPVRGCYLSPVSETGGAQLNTRLPSGIAPGPAQVEFFGNRHVIEVAPIEWQVRIVNVTDAIHIGSKNRIETGGIKVTLEGVEKPSEVSFHLHGRAAEIVQVEFKDPLVLKYEFSFYLPPKMRKGKMDMIIRFSGSEMIAPIEIV